MKPAVRELSAELRERAQRDLNEKPERLADDIKAIREWLAKQPHILGNPDDQTLAAFLRGCKFSLERTKKKLDMYYTVRTALPEFFKDRDIRTSKMRELLSVGSFVPLPGLDNEGRRVLIGRFGQNDPSVYSIEEIFKLNCMMMDFMIREDDHAIICGSVSVMDMSSMTFGHVTQMSPSIMKKSMVIFQDAYPFRPKALNYIHNPPIFETVFKLFKSLANEKIRNRIFVFGDNMEALYQKVPRHLLPNEYGGEAGTIKEINDAWIAKIDTYADWFLSPEGSLGVDESKRPGKPKTHQDLFGLEGSFRQLTVD